MPEVSPNTPWHYRAISKLCVGERWFNGNRISPHKFNTEKDIDAAIKAIRTELGSDE
jgi:hypothetical protein